MGNETVSGSRYKIYHNSVVYGTIIDLRLSIDDYHGHLIRAKELILEIAKKLSQGEWEFEKSTICTRIKKILEDKVREGKVTERWIEECLPTEYKRGYTKSELSSQLKKERKARARKKLEDKQEIELPRELQKILVTTDGTHLPSLQRLEKGDAQEYERLNLENKELKEALHQRDRESFSTADKSLEKEVEFRIRREQFDELSRVMADSERFCYMKFDIKNGKFLRAKSDRSQIKDAITI